MLQIYYGWGYGRLTGRTDRSESKIHFPQYGICQRGKISFNEIQAWKPQPTFSVGCGRNRPSSFLANYPLSYSSSAPAFRTLLNILLLGDIVVILVHPAVVIRICQCIRQIVTKVRRKEPLLIKSKFLFDGNT